MEDHSSTPSDRLSDGGFSNRAVDLSTLPDYRAVALNPMARSFAPYGVVTSVLFWLGLAAAVLVAPRLPFVDVTVPSGLVVVPLAAAVWFGAVAWLDARRRGWALREHDLIYRSGLIWQRTAILPFARIQHVETASGPLERLFGLMRVKCFTAGGMGADLSVEGLDPGSARKVRQHLLEQIRDEDGGGEAARGGVEEDAE
ncbi:MAG: PH domain-containing protein [Wenzhouxiangella sp.]